MALLAFLARYTDNCLGHAPECASSYPFHLLHFTSIISAFSLKLPIQLLNVHDLFHAMATLTGARSPAPRFRSHVAFDSLPAGEATKNNTAAFTLNVRHEGYQSKRRSRTFIVGVDEHEYSDYALKWLLESLVDDGDEVVCVRVIESPTRLGERSYQEDAYRILRRIQEKNEKNKAISIILEYSVGKLHATFQHFVRPTLTQDEGMLLTSNLGRFNYTSLQC